MIEAVIVLGLILLAGLLIGLILSIAQYLVVEWLDD